MEETIKEKLNKLYNHLTYFDIYSSSLFLFLFLMILLILFFLYFRVMTNAKEIKKNWNENRCKPQNILFAGFINKPENKTIFEYTGENFTYCVQNILSNVSSYSFQPFYYLYDSIIDVFNEIKDAIQAIRNIISNIRTNIQNIVTEIMGRLLNIMTPIQMMLSSVMDIFGKVQGILTTGLMTALGAYFTLQSLMGAIIQFIIIILIAMSIVILSLWLGFFTWPAAVAMTAVFVAISIPLTIIVVFMTQMLHIHTSSVPSIPRGRKPSCFDENTEFIVKTEDNKEVSKKIKDLQVYDILKNNSKITSILKLNAKNETMYKLNNVIVSGSHSVLYNNKWLLVKEHPESKIIGNYRKPYLYCINTDTKYIEINNTIFVDWDEIYNTCSITNNFSSFYSHYSEKLNVTQNNKLLEDFLLKNNINNLNDIHLFLDIGFKKYEMIELYNKRIKKIEDVNIGDKLSNGEIVYGIVKLKNRKCLEENIDFLIHLLTDKGSFEINNKIYNDYGVSC